MSNITKEVIDETERILKSGFSLKGIDLNEEEGLRYDLQLALGMAEGGAPDFLIGMLESMRNAFSNEPGIDKIITRQIEKIRV